MKLGFNDRLKYSIKLSAQLTPALVAVPSSTSLTIHLTFPWRLSLAVLERVESVPVPCLRMGVVLTREEKIVAQWRSF